jgi:hypothetical protein
MQRLWRIDDVQNDVEMLRVQLAYQLLRVGKDSLVEDEGAVAGVPAGGAEAGAEVDHRVARQLLFAKGACLVQNLLTAVEGAVRLLKTERPARGQVRIAGEFSILTQQVGGRLAHHQENILRAGDVAGAPDARVCRQVEVAGGKVEVEAPAFAHKPGKRVARAVDAEIVARAVAHAVLRAAAIQGVRARAQAVHGRISALEENLVGLGMEGQFLNRSPPWMLNAHTQRRGLEAHAQIPPRNLRRIARLIGALRVQSRRVGSRCKAAVVIVPVNRLVDRRDSDAQHLRRNSHHRHLHAGRSGVDLRS